VIYSEAPHTGKKIADSGVIWLNEYSKKKVQIDFVARKDMKTLYFVLEDCPDERNLENNILIKEFAVEPKSSGSNPEVPCIQEGIIIIVIIIVAMFVIAIRKPREKNENENSNNDIHDIEQDIKDVEAIALLEEDEDQKHESEDQLEKIENMAANPKKLKKVKKKEEGK
jgi:hypothetical protein